MCVCDSSFGNSSEPHVPSPEPSSYIACHTTPKKIALSFVCYLCTITSFSYLFLFSSFLSVASATTLAGLGKGAQSPSPVYIPPASPHQSKQGKSTRDQSRQRLSPYRRLASHCLKPLAQRISKQQTRAHLRPTQLLHRCDMSSISALLSRAACSWGAYASSGRATLFPAKGV